MKKPLYNSGFSAIELLITLFIAAAFIVSGAQLYSAVIKDGGNANMTAKASSALSTYLQNYKTTVDDPCTPEKPLTNSPISVVGLSNVTISVEITCQNNDTTNSPFAAIGGTVTNIGGYRIHTFTSNGTLTVTGNGNVEALVVAGGGGGGSSQTSSGGGGGGGAGGLIYNTSYNVTSQTYAVTVGNGGAPGGIGLNQPGSNGANSVFDTLTAIGGGYGARTFDIGGNGGSGGGGGYNGYSTVMNGGTGVSGQGYAGGSTSLLAWAGGAGGGGAGGIGGANKINHGGGDRGPGVNISISGSSVTYSTGGSGGENSSAASPANIGKGGDAAYAGGTPYAGGSGVVIIRYATFEKSILSKITATIRYGTPQKTLTDATYAKP